jgi:LCP family protein required for cell wall assembly
MARAHARRARRRTRIDRVTLITLIAFFFAACSTVVIAYFWVRSYISPQTPPPSTTLGGKQTQKANPGIGKSNPAPTGPLQRPNDPTPAPWDGKSRITLLFMGLDYRDWEEDSDIPRTDSMILFSFDPATKSAGMLSIPRDLWVDIPGEGPNKINTAYRLGEMSGQPGGGPGLAMKTVEEALGVPVPYYAMVDFNAFVRFIDEMGGLDMKIREEITIDPIGPGNTRTLEIGTQTLTGAEALAYARNRYAGNDDFDRSQRQQEVIMAIRKQILQFDMLPTLVSKAPKLYQEISSGINTNLSLDQLIRLAGQAAQVDEKKIKRDVLAPPIQVEVATNSADGQSILIPIPDQIRITRDRVFAASGPVQAPATNPATAVQDTPTVTETDLAQLMKDEKATVLIKNGTSSPGLASKAGSILKEMGVRVVGEENADQRYKTTTIYQYSKKPSTKKFVEEKLNLKNSIAFDSADANPPADIVIILGSDWADQQ